MLISGDKNENTFDDKDICLICYDKLDNNISILKCSHKFHYECILMTYKNSKKKQCPYCRGYGDYLKLPDGIVPEYNIHKEYLSYKKQDYNITLIEGRCKHILTQGKNKNKQCSFKSKTDQGYCKRHYNIFVNILDSHT